MDIAVPAYHKVKVKENEKSAETLLKNRKNYGAWK